MIKPPLIDPRTPADVARQVRAALDKDDKLKALGWQEGVTAHQGAGNALVEIFAQMCGVVIDHINRAPERHFLAFLDMLGNSPIPAQPARVPVTFLPDGVIGSGTLVPAGTQVSAPPPAGSKEPLVFETEQDLWVTPFELKKIKQRKSEYKIEKNEHGELKLNWIGVTTDDVKVPQDMFYMTSESADFELDDYIENVIENNEVKDILLNMVNIKENDLPSTSADKKTRCKKELKDNKYKNIAIRSKVNDLLERSLKKKNLINEDELFFAFNSIGNEKIRELSIYISFGALLYDAESFLEGNGSLSKIEWSCWYVDNKKITSKQILIVRDDTNGFSKSGVIVLDLPNVFNKFSFNEGDIVPISEKNSVDEDEKNPAHYWISAKITPSDLLTRKVLNGVVTNTVDALQLETIRNEVLGSSNSRPKQVLQTLHPSIVPGQKLEVQEKRVGNPNLPQVWTEWTEVPDFYASSPTDRHYRINRQTGEISFGDGRNGMIPPAGVRNIRMAHYQVTQGSKGNIAANTLKTLLSSVSGVSKIENRIPAMGGADAETQEAMMERAPKRLRHRDRAVTAEDFEDLAKEASTEVAMAKCVPLVDLASTDPTVEKPGHVSVIIVPHSTDPQPPSSLELLGRVGRHLQERCMGNVGIHVVGMSYFPVQVNVNFIEGIIISENDTQRIKNVIKEFLHPLLGNGGNGWKFGARPYTSDIYAVLIGESGIASIKLPNFETENIDKNQVICAGEVELNIQ